MPRKLRNPKMRRGMVEVSEALFSYLVWNDFQAASALQAPGSSKWELFEGIGAQSHETVWHAIVGEALEAWTQIYPGTRPPSWWRWSAPELRRVYGRFSVVSGNGRCQPTGVPFGEPDDVIDLPMVESTPAYLDRLGLWLEGERDRVPARDFDPRPFNWALTRPVNAAGDDDGWTE